MVKTHLAAALTVLLQVWRNEIQGSKIAMAPAQNLPSSSSTEYTELLAKYMQARLDIAQALLALARSQFDSADSEDNNLTVSILSRKQNLLEELDEVQRNLAPYHNDDPEDRVWAAPARRTHCQNIAEQSRTILLETMRLEEATIRQLETRRQAVAAQLQSGSDSVLASNAYQTSTHLDESVLDIGDA